MDARIATSKKDFVQSEQDVRLNAQDMGDRSFPTPNLSIPITACFTSPTVCMPCLIKEQHDLAVQKANLKATHCRRFPDFEAGYQRIPEIIVS